MNAALPIIEALDRCACNAARAAWLVRAPLKILVLCEGTIRNRLTVAFFHDGIAYLEAELRDMDAWRRHDGLVSVDLLAARGRMRALAGDLLLHDFEVLQ
ncbi:hypothetical protein DEM27_00080 [Metarhizobium album]|uniref:Uncharacterized protein n=1 Tax=Metarhizobium album TaxID=2182425 RepID=A0A2U2DWE4_9HYPH|nr:hypothetical protein [Rhizobium album]PWE57648.1 hypothetical protein DEM27_00080 [Rhizobium album]